MSNRLRAKAKNGVIDIKTIIKHTMETGLRKDRSGNIIPAHHITHITVTRNGKNIITSNIGAAVSKNPYFRFKIAGNKGDEITISFIDNKGETGSVTGTAT